MFQWPWLQGQSWLAVGGFDNGKSRSTSSPHYYKNGGALDLAPRNGIKIGSDTSQDWVAAAADGTIVSSSNCYLKISHDGGWTTEYYHMDKVQVKSGKVSKNQKLGVIANNKNQATCSGGDWQGPHLHFVLRSSMQDAQFSGWKVSYDANADRTSFTKNGVVKYLFQSVDNPAVATPAPIVTTPDPNIIKNGSSSLYQDKSWGRANLKVCADNLAGNTVNVLFSRPGRTWEYSQKATSRCVTFWDMDGAGPLNRGTTYTSRVALNQKPEWKLAHPMRWRHRRAGIVRHAPQTITDN